jgi:hypothetical protein
MSALATLAPGTASVRIRSTFGQWAWLLGAVTVAIALTQAGMAFAFRGTPGVTEQGLLSVATFAVTWSVLSALLFRWQGVTLAPDALHVHSLQARTIRWVDIASVSTDRMLGTTYVIVWEASGRSTRLRAPTTGLLAWDRDFQAKYQTITAWHQALRGSADPG